MPTIQFTIESAERGGFVVIRDGAIVAAFSTAEHLADWIEHECGSTDTEQQRRAAALAETQDTPRIVQPGAVRAASWIRRGQ